MENKNKHIDKFLEAKLSHFESEPDVNAFIGIESVLDHLKHPIDQALNIKLSELNIEPNAEILPVIIGNPMISEHPVDQLLSDRLSMLEAQPKSGFSEIDQLKNKRGKKRVFIFFSTALILLLGSILIYQLTDSSQDKTKLAISDPAQATHLPKNNISKQNTDLSEVLTNDVSKNEYLSNSKQSKNQYSSQNITVPERKIFKVKSETNYKNEDAIQLETSESNVLTDESIQSLLLPIGFNGFSHSLKLNSNDKIKGKRIKSLFAYSPIYFHISMGLSMENNSKNSSTTENLHKDALNLHEKGNGKNKIGLSFTLGMGYQLSKRIDVKIGLKYTEMSTSQNLNYVYTDIPVYDTTGKLKGYITRPASSSLKLNQEVRSKSIYLSAPVQINLGVFQSRLFKLSLGLGMEYNFTHNSQGEFFNFNTSKMESYISKSKNNIIPGMSINGLYRLRAGMQLNAVLGFQRMKINQTIGGIEMQSQFGIPSLTLGLIYTPIIKL